MSSGGAAKKPGLDGAAHEDPQWHVMSKESVMETLATGPDGISSDEAAKRLAQHGPNEMTSKEKKTLLQRIWAQINNVLVAILIVVAVVSAVKAATSDKTDSAVTSWIEVGLILGVICLNTWIGILMEGSAEKAAEKLKDMLASNATVVRGGTEMEIEGRDIVPGDVIIVRTGDRVPADIRMFKVTNLACQEAALTGESLAVEKMTQEIEADRPSEIPLGDRTNMCFSATLVERGEGRGIVVATGDDTQIGTINALVNNVEEKKTNVLRQIDMVSKWIAVFVVFTAIITFLVTFLYTGLPALESVNIGLVCAVAMIPEGLAAIVTLTYAYAVSNMAKHNAIVRVLPAVETLGSVTVICSDKTGTLTKNEMTLATLVTSNARYKFDTNSKQRVSSNFVRDDSFMASRNEELAGGDDTKSVKVKTSSMAGNDDVPVANGASPSTEFFQRAMAGGVLCSKCKLGKNGGRDGEIGNPTELAILRSAHFAGVDCDGMRSQAPILSEVPFSSEYKFMATVHEPIRSVDGAGVDEDSLVVHVKGAPDRMVNLCSHQAKAGNVDETEPIDPDYWQEQISILSSYGLRVLALCRGQVPRKTVQPGEDLLPDFVLDRGEPWLTMVCICGIMDPPRPECVGAIAEAQSAGVRVAMITGDHKDTAKAIGGMLGLVTKTYSGAITGPELDDMDEDQLRVAVMRYNVFARASPQNKLQIVNALQAEGQVCSMTGDGVNDAPALKAADMGVAMGKEGTDVAREASQMILADDNFATIVRAVREGRVVWDNLRKVLMVNTPINNAQGMSVLFGMIFGLEDTPLTPIQVLYCNMVCAVTLGFVLAVEPAERGIMKKMPRRVNKRLIGRFLLLRIIIGTITLVALTVGSVFWAKSLGHSLDEERSQALNTLTFCAVSICLSARFEYDSALHPRLLFGNYYCWVAVAIVTVLQLSLTYIPGLNSVVFSMAPMNGVQWGIVVLFMVITFLVMELEKAIRRNLKTKGHDTSDLKPDEMFDR